MPAEVRAAVTTPAADDDLRHHHHETFLLQDGPAHRSRPPLPIMPTPSPPSSSQRPSDQQQPPELNSPTTSTPRGLNNHTNTNDENIQDFCPDPRLATAAAAAAALRAGSHGESSSPSTKKDAPSGPDDIGASASNGGASASATAATAASSYQRLVKRYRVEVAASASSVLSTLTTFPLDSVKTRMQTYRYAGFLDCVRHTYRTERLRGFFRGVTAPMASITLVRTVSFSIYQRSKHTYCDWVKRNFGFDVMGHVSSKGSYPNLWTVATFGAAGATAGSCITVIACPFELTKLSAQVSVLLADKKNCPRPESHAIAASYQNKGTVKTLGNIIKHRGFSGLYTGFSLHLMRDTLGTATYFMTYESSKQLLTTFGGDGTHSNPLAVLVAGGLCGIVSWALIYPVDSAKSIYQRNSLMYSKGQKVEPVKIQFFKRNMYRGLGVSMGRSCAVNAVFFSSFEFLKKRIKAMDDQ